MNSYGVAFFHDNAKPFDSKITFCTEELAGEARSLSELSHKKVWFTNIGRPIFIVNGLLEQTHLKPAEFISPSFGRILKELGMELTNEELPNIKVLRALVEIYNRVMLYAANSLKCSSNQLITPSKSSLSLVLNDFYSEVEDEQLIPDLLKDAFQDALLLSTRNASESITNDDKIIHLSFPRAAYSMAILNSLVPYGEWSVSSDLSVFKEISGPDLIPLLDQIFEGRSGLVQVKMPRSANEKLPLHRLYNANGQWLTLQEAKLLAKVAPLKVIKLAYSKEQIILSELLGRYGWRTPETVEGLSYSVGLFLEEFWKALGNERPSRVNQKNYTPSYATYIQSWDRIFCLRAAEAVQNRGFKILAYGNNTVSVGVPKEQVSKLLAYGYQLGIANLNLSDSNAFLNSHDYTLSTTGRAFK